MTTAPEKSNWSRPLVVLGISLGLSVAAVAVWFIRNESANRLNRAALLSLHMGLEPGQTVEVVREKIHAAGSAALRLRENSSTDWFVTMPLEWGGSDWLLRIEFANGRASAIRVRNRDGGQPAGAPRDKVALQPPPSGKRLKPSPDVIKVSSLLSPC